MDIAMHYVTIGMQCMQLHDNATYLMHYNAFVFRIMHYNALKTFYSALAT